MLPSLTACNDVALEGLASMLRPRLPAWPISQNRDEPHVVCSRLVEAGKRGHCAGFDASAYAAASQFQTPGAVLHGGLVLNFARGGVVTYRLF